MSGLFNPSPATSLKFDASDNVLANINAQNINPNSANPYALTLLSHQTGLSNTVVAGNTYYNIGSAISIPRNGILKHSIIGHVNANLGSIVFTLTRAAVIYNLSPSLIPSNPSFSIVTDFNSTTNGFQNTVPSILLKSGSPISTTAPTTIGGTFELLVLNGDSIQYQVSGNAAGTIVYIDDLIVMLQ